MTYQNAQFKNSGNDEGDVLDFFNDTLRNLVQKNGGDNTFSFVTEEFLNKDAPMPVGTKTRLKLTHSGHTISQIEKGFINATVEFKVKFQNNIAKDAISKIDTEGLNLIFIGFKNAVEFIEDCRFWVNGKLIDTYRQDELIRESFAYNSIKARDAKAANPHAHSIWENVMNYMPCKCGVYIPLAKFEDGKDVDVKLDLIIPFTDQLALQAWRLYPNRILGEVEEEIRTSLDALVWCQIDPKAVADVLKFMNYDATKEYSSPWILPITAHFTQIGMPAKIVHAVTEKALNAAVADASTDFKASSIKDAKENHWTVKFNTLQLANHGEIKIARTNCAGFGVKPNVIEGLYETLKTPIIVPAQELTREIFEGTAKAEGLDVSKSIPLRNATNITLMFPRHPGDITCFQNIMYQHCQLTVNKRQYPDTEFETTHDGRFVQHQLIANELDGCIEATDELVRSFSLALNDEVTGKRYKATSAADNTSFGINFQLERGNAGYVFDGIDTGCHSITVNFKGQPIHKGEDDTYFYPDVLDNGTVVKDVHPPAPEMWICSDTYWTWSIDGGVRYHARGVPTGYE